MKDVFVGNLAYETSEDELRQLFAAYGPVARVTILTHRYSGQPRGYASVERAGAGDADKADHRAEWYSTPQPQARCQ
jgi:RNA recognition motif-containing protein